MAVGCAGELWLLLNKAPDFNETDHPQNRWSKLLRRLFRPFVEASISFLVRRRLMGAIISKSKEHRRGRLFVMLVAFGVALEWVSIPFSLVEVARVGRDAAEAKERASGFEREAAAFRLKADELEARTRTRIITDDERRNFIECLRAQPKGPVQINFDRGASANVRFYANEIAEIFIAAGYSVPKGVDICDIKPILPADASIEIMTKSLKDGPDYFVAMANCLTNVADKVVPVVYSSAFWFSTNEVWIYVANQR